MRALFNHSILLILLAGVSWTNIVASCYWLEGERLELFSQIDFDGETEESENENKTEEELDDEIRFEFHLLQFLADQLALVRLHQLKINSLHLQDTITPPPEYHT